LVVLKVVKMAAMRGKPKVEMKVDKMEV